MLAVLRTPQPDSCFARVARTALEAAGIILAPLAA